MCNNTRLIVAVGVVCLAIALTDTTALAGMNRWTAIGPDGAEVVALLIDPLTPSTAFAGTSRSGVLKTTDSGATWATANSGLPTANVLALAIDPVNPSTLYVGTDVGAFKSADSGRNWAPVNNGLGDAMQVTVIAVDPVTPATLYAGTSGGVFKSTNGASSWISSNAGLSGLAPRVITIDPTSPATVYVGVDDTIGDFNYGVFKSTDGGTTWARIYRSLPYEDGGAPSASSLVIDSSSPSRLYMAIGAGLAKSLDGGASWSTVNAIASPVRLLAIDPTSTATVYVGTYNGLVFKSTDAGDHWMSASDGLQASNVNAIAMAASAPATLYVGVSNGIFRSSDRAETWTHLTLGVRNVGVGPVAVDPVMASTIYANAGGAVAKTTDGGVHWADSGLGLAGEEVLRFVIDPTSPSTLYAITFHSIYKSNDAGAHWAPLANGLPSFGVRLLTIAPSSPSTLYAGVNFSGVLKSKDGGLTWARVNNGLTAVGIYVSDLAVDPTNADVVYVATPPTGRPDTDAKLFKSTDGAAHWRQVPIALPSGTEIRALAIDSATPSTLYAAYNNYGDPSRGGVFKSNDSGETWAAAQDQFPAAWVWALAIDPSSPARIYAATQAGVFVSNDAAANWIALNSGLPSLDVYDFAVDRTGSLLRAATGAGLFEYRIGPPSPPPATVPVIEYFHAGFGHYFVTSDVDEITKLDNGTTVGWKRTGFRFNAYATSGDDTSPVCRFFSTAFAPKSSHFYTPFAFECTKVQANADWLLESIAAFNIAVPDVDGSCAAGTVPVYRMYNDGQGAAPNHRYTTDFNERANMLAQRWVPEGIGADAVEMCSPL
ncbi:MAG TPA: hypothetical protein VGL25_15770 [Casimicrobiaceae bacterium]|jgi:photosystem II stability/assembly factor-like uncharacterized protein